MSETRQPGWWIPEPSNSVMTNNNGPDRTRRFRFFAALAMRLWMALSIGFGGLLWADPHLSSLQAFFGAAVFGGGTGLVLVLIIAILWNQ